MGWRDMRYQVLHGQDERLLFLSRTGELMVYLYVMQPSLVFAAKFVEKKVYYHEW
jgi:hypothetical protein